MIFVPAIALIKEYFLIQSMLLVRYSLRIKNVAKIASCGTQHWTGVYLAFYAFAINPVCVHNKWMTQRQRLTSKHQPSTAPKKHRSLCCRKSSISCYRWYALLSNKTLSRWRSSAACVLCVLRAQTGRKRPTAPNLPRTP